MLLLVWSLMRDCAAAAVLLNNAAACMLKH
jgi:hypothetical protein